MGASPESLAINLDQLPTGCEMHRRVLDLSVSMLRSQAARVAELESKFSEQRISDVVYIDWHNSLRPSERSRLSFHTMRRLVTMILSDEPKDGWEE